MRPLIKKIKPSRGFGYVAYLILNVFLPVLVLLLVKAELGTVALAVILLSKWRMFAVQPRFWIANIRSNAVDILLGLSMLGFMMGTLSDWTRVVYALLWAVWLIFLKPRNSPLMVSLQALTGQTAALMAIFSTWSRSPLILLVLAVGSVCFFAAHHFFYSFDEPYIRLLSYVWGYFGAALTWVLGHWLLYHTVVSQVTLIITAVALGLGTLYYLDHFDRLSKFVRREVMFIMSAVIVIMAGALLFIEAS